MTTPQRKAYDASSKWPEAVDPWLQSPGTPRWPQQIGTRLALSKWSGCLNWKWWLFDTGLHFNTSTGTATPQSTPTYVRWLFDTGLHFNTSTGTADTSVDSNICAVDMFTNGLSCEGRSAWALALTSCARHLRCDSGNCLNENPQHICCSPAIHW